MRSVEGADQLRNVSSGNVRRGAGHEVLSVSGSQECDVRREVDDDGELLLEGR